jgi:hypothetical protein
MLEIKSGLMLIWFGGLGEFREDIRGWISRELGIRIRAELSSGSPCRPFRSGRT